MTEKKLSELKAGESGSIVAIAPDELAEKLMEMGCLINELVTVKRIAPPGDPMLVTVSSYDLSLRKSEAALVLVQLQNSLS